MKLWNRRQYVIDRAFQTRFALYMVSGTLAIGLIFPLIIRDLYESFLRYAAANPFGPPYETLLQTRQEFLPWIWGSVVFFVLGMTILSVFISHRIAGPIFKTERALRDLAQGNAHPISFRKHDHFLTLAQAFNDSVQTFQRFQTETKKAKQLLEEGNAEEAKKILSRL